LAPPPTRKKIGVKGLFRFEQGLRIPPARSMAARGQSLLPVAAEVTKSASPCTPLYPPVLATGGTKTNRPKVALTRNQWAHGFSSWTARCSAPRRGLKGRENAIDDHFVIGYKTRTCFASKGYARGDRPIDPSRATRALEETGGPLELASLPAFWAMPESRSAAGPKPGEVASYARS
jgi:hypothetical protein